MGLYDTTAELGLKRLEGLLDTWRQQQFTDVNNHSFCVSLAPGWLSIPRMAITGKRCFKLRM